jgi:hypothetical protein
VAALIGGHPLEVCTWIISVVVEQRLPCRHLPLFMGTVLHSRARMVKQRLRAARQFSRIY